jgi:nicotinate-nucleotide adenylyltransferase
LGLTTSANVQRLGVFGGAFDPPHVAHFELARAAIETFELDALRILPTGQAWHKARPLTAAAHRLAMAQLAFATLPKAIVDSREVDRSGPTYTVDTLSELKAEFPAAELFLIMGEDQAVRLTRWHQWETILRLAIICVAERDDSGGDRPRFTAPQAYESRFRRLQIPALPVSATDIRIRIATHLSVAPLVFEPVARYIDHHHLYQTTR